MTNNQQLTPKQSKLATGQTTKNLLPRPPIVVVMGHIDHGKTTLLDYIRKTNIAFKEAGGITQGIGAYSITHNSKFITFIDTPGHEAFSKMRARGVKVADLAILVVAADDGVKPQTKEVIEILKSAETPFIVAINKIDKSNADIERVKQELMQAGILLEGFGGNISWQAISAKTGQGINELLDLIVLAAEMEGLSYDPKAPGQGVIIESKMDSRRGLTAMAIVRNGTLRIGDKIHTPTASGKVKILENFMGQGAEELSPSSPALILGFNNLPQVGEEFTAGLQIDTNLPQISQISVPTTLPICEIGAQISDNSRVIKVFLKADVAGSLEVLSEIIKAIPEAKIVEEALGNVSDGDVKNAGSLGAAIIGFKVKPTKAAENLAKSQDVKIINSEIIYELLKKLEEEIEILRKPLPQAELTILAVFSQRGKKQVIGGRVESGMIRVNSPVKIFRGENEVGSGKILNLQQAKKDTTQVGAAEECGILFESDILTAVGDRLIHEAPSRTS